MTGSSRRHAFSRRAVLRGSGCAMALPWLESVAAMAAEPTAADFPKRFGVVFFGCGINEDHWSASGEGANMTLSRTLQPLEPIKTKINVVDGLYVPALVGQGIHPGQTGSILSGGPIAKGALIQSGISVDQMIANTIGQDSPQQSVVLACDQPMTGYHETNFSLAYSSHISWQTPDSPVPLEVYPSLAWDSLFDNRGSMLNLSVLDRVKHRAADLSRKVSSGDRAKLDEFLTSVRDVEKRLELRQRWTNQPKPKAPFDKPANRNAVDDLPLLYEMIALALQSDSTRIATLEIGGDFMPQNLGIKKDWHGLSHHGNDAEAIASLITLEKYQIEHLGKFITRLSKMNDGDRTLLESTAVLFGSGMGDGNSHKNSDLPIILAGGGYKHGEFREVPREGINKVPLCNLFVDIAQKMGVETDSFGNSTGRFA